MPQVIARGATFTGDLVVRDHTGALADATDLVVDVLAPNGSTILNDQTPVHDALGMYHFEWPAPGDADLGAYAFRWTGVIDGSVASVDDGFTVVMPGSMSPPVSGGVTCQPWIAGDQLACAQTYDVDPDDAAEAAQVATDILYLLSGSRFAGICSDTVRPQAQWRNEAVPRWWPATGDARWGFCSCHRPRETGCARVPEIKLPGYPVDPRPANMTIMLDGNQLDPSSYRIDDHRYVVRVDGEGWPCCQHLTLDDTEPGTFSIAYLYGRAPDVGGVRAAHLLACQFLLAWHPDQSVQKKCRLPERVTSITRQGISVAVLDPLKLFDEGKTGIASVDMWVSSKLIGQKRRRAAVIVPSRVRSVRRAGQ